MKQSQAEIKAIQAKLQAIQAGRTTARPPSLPAMVELTPNSITPNAATGTAATATISGRWEQGDLTVAAEVLQQRSASYLKQFQPPLPQSAPQLPQRATAERQVVEALRRLETQAQHINDLASAQEAALRELKAIAERVERDRKAAELEREPLSGSNAEIPAVCEYVAAAVPHIEKDEKGLFILTTRSIDLFRAEREATMTAQALRYRTNKSNHLTRHKGGASRRRNRQSQGVEWGQLLLKQVSAIVNLFTSVTDSKVKVSSRAASVRHSEPLEMPSFSLQDAAVWVFGAVVARVGLDLLLASFPGLWIPVIGLIVTPAAIALYRTTVAPQSGFVWGYRLLLVMVGLLIGGRL